jgi:hypothetical protein
MSASNWQIFEEYTIFDVKRGLLKENNQEILFGI